MTGESAPLEEGPAVADPICPYLGMVGDRNGHHSFPSRLHLCHAGEPAHIGLGFQSDYCLGGGYPSCARYQRAEEAAAAAGATAGAVGGAALAVDGSVATSAPAPVPASSAKLGSVRSPSERRSSPVVTILLGLALISTLAAFAIAAGFIKLPAGGIAVVTTPPPTIPASATPPLTTDTPAPSPSPTPTTVPPTATPSAAAGEITHIVQAGETLTSISELYNVPIAAIVARNGITDPNSIVAGQTLIIPVAGASASPTTAPTATVTPVPSTTPNSSSTPSATSFVYVVKAGDTLGGIADRFNVSLQAILDANPDITDPNKIFIGQQIVIPAAP